MSGPAWIVSVQACPYSDCTDVRVTMKIGGGKDDLHSMEAIPNPCTSVELRASVRRQKADLIHWNATGQGHG